jgi:hypothetical protein
LAITTAAFSNRSVLEGALEVFGKNAAVVIANPNSFYCDKCSFINTSKLTMVSGRSEIKYCPLFTNIKLVVVVYRNPNRVGVCDVD